MQVHRDSQDPRDRMAPQASDPRERLEPQAQMDLLALQVNPEIALHALARIKSGSECWRCHSCGRSNCNQQLSRDMCT